MTRLRAEGVGHTFPGAEPLFADLALEVGPGEVVAIVGPSGSGKSTLLSLLAGWEAPTRGTIEREEIRSIGWVFQNPHGTARRTALDHVVLPLLARGAGRREAEREALEIMATFGLGPVSARPFRALSGGEAQRLMLARAVATAPDLLLVDEPTAQLDVHTAETVNRVLAGVAQRRSIVLVATHDPRTRDACARVVDLADYQSSSAGLLS